MAQKERSAQSGGPGPHTGLAPELVEIRAKEEKSGWDWGRFNAQLNRFLGPASPVLILLLWELFSRTGILKSAFFPPPTAIAGTFWDLTVSGELLRDVYVSLLRILGGFFLGAIPGLIIGLSMGLFRPIRIFLRPIVSVTYPIPKLALMPLIILIFGLGEIQKVTTIAMGTVFMVLINTLAGVVNLDDIYLDVARNFGASRRDFYLRVALPGAMPLIFAGLELGMGMALLLIVAAEMVGTLEGIGARIWTAQQLYKIEEMFVAFILIAALGYVFAQILSLLERRFVPWKES